MQTQILAQYKEEEEDDDEKSEWDVSILARMRKLCMSTFLGILVFFPDELLIPNIHHS